MRGIVSGRHANAVRRHPVADTARNEFAAAHVQAARAQMHREPGHSESADSDQVNVPAATPDQAGDFIHPLTRAPRIRHQQHV
ncbi:MAG: hypothetical protein BWY59_02302 [Verrucomicrobia bacterium ADurb.Bin345]|nr:MAG: hypothetical protein BWY59_02302 [Verrucomicrobia bacterium ADurb.Bin345]